MSREPDFFLADKSDESHAPLLEQLPGLFEKMYDHFNDVGGSFDLVEGAGAIWLKQSTPGLGITGQIALATHEGRVVGFVQCMVRGQPGYFEKRKVGFIAHTYVDPTFRKAGIARKLHELCVTWMTAGNADRVELQVVAENAIAMDFWKRLGYETTLVSMNLALKNS